MKNKSSFVTLYFEIEKFAADMFNDLEESKLIKKINRNSITYQIIFVEIFMLFIWELDVCLFSANQKEEVRRKCLNFISDKMIYTYLTEYIKENIKILLIKRLSEYEEVEHNDTMVGSLQDLLTNFFMYNVHYAEENDEFYYCEGTRPLYLGASFKELYKFGKIVGTYHFRIRGILSELFKNCNDFTLLTKEEFENRIYYAELKDTNFKKEIYSIQEEIDKEMKEVLNKLDEDKKEN